MSTREHSRTNGRTVVEQFAAENPRLSEAEREMLLGWQDVVQGPFEVLRAAFVAQQSMA